MRTAVGHSDDVDTLDAIEQVIEESENELGGETPKAALIFMSVEYEHQVALKRLQQKWNGLPVIGASTDGEFSDRHGFAHDSMLLILFAGEDIEASVGLGRDLSQDTAAAVERATSSLGNDPKIAVTTFSPNANASEVVHRLASQLGREECPIVGGLSGDHHEFAHMVEFYGEEILTDSLPILCLSGRVEVGFGIGTGWFPMGDTHRVTSSEGSVVTTIDDKPAAQIYEKYWGEVSDGILSNYPLAVYSEESEQDYVLRTAVALEDGTVRYAGAVPEGASVRMTEVVQEGLLSGSEQSIGQAMTRFQGEHPQLALVFSCSARKWVLGSKAKTEVTKMENELGGDSSKPPTLVGLYCFGEIAPFDTGRESQFHNESCVSVILGQ